MGLRLRWGLRVTLGEAVEEREGRGLPEGTAVVEGQLLTLCVGLLLALPVAQALEEGVRLRLAEPVAQALAREVALWLGLALRVVLGERVALLQALTVAGAEVTAGLRLRVGVALAQVLPLALRLPLLQALVEGLPLPLRLTLLQALALPVPLLQALPVAGAEVTAGLPLPLLEALALGTCVLATGERDSVGQALGVLEWLGLRLAVAQGLALPVAQLQGLEVGEVLPLRLLLLQALAQAVALLQALTVPAAELAAALRLRVRAAEPVGACVLATGERDSVAQALGVADWHWLPVPLAAPLLQAVTLAGAEVALGEGLPLGAPLGLLPCVVARGVRLAVAQGLGLAVTQWVGEEEGQRLAVAAGELARGVRLRVGLRERDRVAVAQAVREGAGVEARGVGEGVLAWEVGWGLREAVVHPLALSLVEREMVGVCLGLPEGVTVA